jgi:hypothetical protein
MADELRFKGLKELDRALGKADKQLRTGLRDKLRDAGKTVASEARAIAESKQLRVTGDLISSIKPFALTGRAGVRDTARHRGYAYPSRIEYEGRGGAKYGPRAFLNPAVDRKTGEITRSMETLLDRFADDFGGK